MSRPVLVVGAGGHAKVVVDVLRSAGWQVQAVFDDDASRHGAAFHGAVIVGGIAAIPDYAVQHGVTHFIVALGANALRLQIAARLEAAGLQAISAVHASVVLGRGVEIGVGTVLMPGVCINADTRIGRHVIINTRATVDHDCHIADGVHLGPGSVLCGGVSIGRAVLVGAGASLIPGMSVGEGACVGAGAAVVTAVAAGFTVAGVPARILEKKK